MARPSGGDINDHLAANTDDKATADGSNSKPASQDKVLSASANLAQLLPTGSVMAYQALSPSFNNHGECYTSNWWLTVSLITFLTVFCIFFAFTDSITHKGKVYYGVAMRGGLKIFNIEAGDNIPERKGKLKKEPEEPEKELSDEQKKVWKKLKKRRLHWLDGVHAFFTAVVFLSVAFSDVGLQKCLFPKAGHNTMELLKNMPLGRPGGRASNGLAVPSRTTSASKLTARKRGAVGTPRTVASSPSQRSSTATTRKTTSSPRRCWRAQRPGPSGKDVRRAERSPRGRRRPVRGAGQDETLSTAERLHRRALRVYLHAMLRRLDGEDSKIALGQHSHGGGDR